MKTKLTLTKIKSYSNVKYAEYCKLQNLLSHREPDAYHCGIYGWNFDVYFINGVTICTGSRGLPGKRLEGIEHYEQKAREVRDLNASHEQKKQKLDALINEFCTLNGGW